MLAALQGPAYPDHRTRGGHAPGQPANVFRGNPRQRRRPVRILGPTVGFAQEIGRESFETGAVSVDEGLVVQTLGEQGVRNAEHDRDVGIGAARPPFRVQEIAHVIPNRADVDTLDAASRHLAQLRLRGMRADTEGHHLSVLHRGAAETDEQSGFTRHLRHRWRLIHQHRGWRAKHVRQDVFGGRHRVGILGIGKSADRVHEAVQLGRRVVETPGAGPAIRAGEYRLVAMRRACMGECFGGNLQRLFPGHGYKRLASALAAVAVPPFGEVTPANHRLWYPTAGVLSVSQ